jgi:type II secretory ATPase GspE/PulE/Tfp pilus assembly ATPase PilB-like protein
MNINERIKDAELVTRPGGSVAISSSLRDRVAIFENGVILIRKGDRWSADVKMAMTTARRVGIPISDENLIEVDPSIIMDLYAATGDANSTTKLELDRQVALADIIRQAANEGASDIHMRILPRFTEIRIRVFSRVKDFSTCDQEEGKALIKAAFAVSSDTSGGSSEMSFKQGSLTPEKSKLLPPKVDMIRLQYSPSSDGRGALVMRLSYKSNSDEVEIDHLGYNAQQISDIKTMRTRTNGMYVLAGKVSSGKTTTLQRVLNKMFLEKRREISIYTIEEPVELDIPSAMQIPVKKADDFVLAMKASLRSDPNVIVMGETRSQETSNLAIQAVMTGHALWTTVHAGTALGILDRFVDLGVPPWKLQEPTVVRGLAYQRLAGVICPNCRINFRDAVKQGELDVKLANKLIKLFRKSPDNLYVRGEGCPQCKHGLIGRTVVAETVLTDPTLLEYFAKGQRTEMREYWLRPKKEGGLGGIPVLHHALSKVGAGLCDINEIEEEVDLFSTYERDYMHLAPRLRKDVSVIEEEEAAKKDIANSKGA